MAWTDTARRQHMRKGPRYPSDLRDGIPRAGGWSNAPSHGSAGAAAWPKAGRNPLHHRPHGPQSPASECSRAELQTSQLIDELLSRALKLVYFRIHFIDLSPLNSQYAYLGPNIITPSISGIV